MKRKKLTKKYYAALLAQDQKLASKLWIKLLRKSLKGKKTYNIR